MSEDGIAIRLTSYATLCPRCAQRLAAGTLATVDILCDGWKHHSRDGQAYLCEEPVPHTHELVDTGTGQRCVVPGCEFSLSSNAGERKQ